MFSSFKKLSSKVALGGAEDAIDEAKAYIGSNPHEKVMMCEMSKQLFEQAIMSLGMSLDDDFFAEELYTPEFHRIAHQIKQRCGRNYNKNTAEWIASNLAMAGCSILGASPELPKRERVWKQLIEVWDS